MRSVIDKKRVPEKIGGRRYAERDRGSRRWKRYDGISKNVRGSAERRQGEVGKKISTCRGTAFLFGSAIRAILTSSAGRQKMPVSRCARLKNDRRGAEPPSFSSPVLLLSSLYLFLLDPSRPFHPCLGLLARKRSPRRLPARSPTVLLSPSGPSARRSLGLVRFTPGLRFALLRLSKHPRPRLLLRSTSSFAFTAPPRVPSLLFPPRRSRFEIDRIHAYVARARPRRASNNWFVSRERSRQRIILVNGTAYMNALCALLSVATWISALYDK